MRSRAELYDWELRHVLERTDQDVPWYLALAARAGGPVLELACGTGRVAAPLVAAGHTVVGVDIDVAMLQAARHRGVHQLVAADMRRFSLRSSFGLALIAYNSLQLLLSDADRVATLTTALDHLRPGGLLALELTDFQDGDVDPWVEPEELASVDGITLWGSLFHDTDQRVTRYARRYEAEGESFEDETALCSLLPPDVEDLLARCGAEVIEHVTEGPRGRWVACRP